MREILFRGKHIKDGESNLIDLGDKKVGEWIEGNFAKKYNGSYQIEEIEENWWYDVDPSTVGQYTGLHDKNGVYIFEGDILKFNAGIEYGIFEVKFENSAFIAYWITQNNFCDIQTCMMYLQCSSELEVIGNIFDNVELVKE